MARLKPTKKQIAEAAAALPKSFSPCVSSHGYTDAQIMFLQGFPLKDDLLQGKALSGSSEKTLATFLKEHHISVNRVYKSIYIREKLEYSATNPKKLRIALSKIDTSQYEELLRAEINEVKPNVIVPLDDIALAAVFPHINSIHKPKGRKYWINCYRGSILPLREDWQQDLGPENIARVIPTIGPQLLWSDWSARAYVGIDYKRIVDNSNKRSKIEKVGMVWVAKNYDAFTTFLRRSYEKRPNRVSFDIETYGGLITCISFCFDGNEACTVPLSDTNISIGELALLWGAVSLVLRDPFIEKSNQNIKYDWTILEREGFIVNNVRSDTMLKGSVLYPELPKGLDFWTSIYTDIPYYKDEGKEFNPKLHSRDRLYIYCGYDSLSAHQIATEQDKELEESGMKDFYETEVAPSILIYKDMDRTGILVDQDQRQKLNEKYEILYQSNVSTLRTLINKPDFNPNSPTQVGDLLYTEMGFPFRRKTDPETGRVSWKTDKDTLDDLLIYHADSNKFGKVGAEVISRQIVCRKLSKVIEYINTPIHSDGRFKGSSNLAGTETGRSSSSKTIDERLRYDGEKGTKPVKRLGRSLQTITKHGFTIDEDIFDDFDSKVIADDIRSMFVPHKDHVFIEGDGSGAEARVVFVLAEDYNGLASMDQKPKIHAKTAAKFFGIPVENIKKDANGNWTPSIPKVGITYYDMGKKGRHAGNYDMGAFRLTQMTHLDIIESTRILDIFHTNEPNIRRIFHAGVIQQLRLDRTLINPFGRKRTFFSDLNDKTFKEGFAQIPQGTISDLTKFTAWRIKEALQEDWYYKLYRFLAEMHDALFSEVHKDIAMKYMETFKKIYERPISFRNMGQVLSRDFDLVIPLELSWSSTNWNEMKEIHL